MEAVQRVRGLFAGALNRRAPFWRSYQNMEAQLPVAVCRGAEVLHSLATFEKTHTEWPVGPASWDQLSLLPENSPERTQLRTACTAVLSRVRRDLQSPHVVDLVDILHLSDLYMEEVWLTLRLDREVHAKCLEYNVCCVLRWSFQTFYEKVGNKIDAGRST